MEEEEECVICKYLLENIIEGAGLLNINKNMVLSFLDTYTEVVLLSISVWNNLLIMSIQPNVQYYQQNLQVTGIYF